MISSSMVVMPMRWPFRFEKCAVLKVKRGNQVPFEGINLGGRWCSDRGDDEEGYKY